MIIRMLVVPVEEEVVVVEKEEVEYYLFKRGQRLLGWGVLGKK